MKAGPEPYKDNSDLPSSAYDTQVKVENHPFEETHKCLSSRRIQYLDYLVEGSPGTNEGHLFQSVDHANKTELMVKTHLLTLTKL